MWETQVEAKAFRDVNKRMRQRDAVAFCARLCNSSRSPGIDILIICFCDTERKIGRRQCVAGRTNALNVEVQK